MMPVQPWCAIFCHMGGSYAASVSMSRRTSAMGHSAEKNSRAEFFKTCWVSVNPNCMALSLIALGQTQDKVSDDVALDLGRAGLDGIAARPQVGVRPLTFVESV